MRNGQWTGVVAAGLLTAGLATAYGQEQAAPASTPASQAAQPAATAGHPDGVQVQVQASAPGQGTEPAAPAKKTYTVPAGTKVLLQLRSSVNTKSAKAGDGVYLASAFPVVVGNRVMIPAGVYVQGVVDRVQRAGHVKGHAARFRKREIKP